MTRLPHDDLPTLPTQRRIATLLGCLIIVLILAGLVWFAVRHLETEEPRGFLGLRTSWAAGGRDG